MLRRQSSLESVSNLPSPVLLYLLHRGLALQHVQLQVFFPGLSPGRWRQQLEAIEERLAASPSFAVAVRQVAEAVALDPTYVQPFFPVSAELVLAVVAERYGVSVAELCSKNNERKYSNGRPLAAYLLYTEAKLPSAEVARVMSHTVGGVPQIFTAFKKGLAKSHATRREAEAVMVELRSKCVSSRGSEQAAVVP